MTRIGDLRGQGIADMTVVTSPDARNPGTGRTGDRADGKS
jgi:hypothetical protein